MSAGKNNNGYSFYNKVQLVKGGSCYFNLLQNLIQNAKHSIHIRVYIWDDDETGISVADQLIEAAKRGVAVYAIADGYASQGLSKNSNED
ncbi:MAG TPA: phospholipase D-like domain-containing protein [Flavisolibacter sp.]|nr:phospholipase D-like domain-containing protein [Flavisolibacter sp.]